MLEFSIEILHDQENAFRILIRPSFLQRYVPIHHIMDMVAQAAGAGLTVQRGGVGIGRADMGVSLTRLFGLGSAVE